MTWYDALQYSTAPYARQWRNGNPAERIGNFYCARALRRDAAEFCLRQHYFHDLCSWHFGLRQSGIYTYSFLVFALYDRKNEKRHNKEITMLLQAQQTK